MQYGNSVLSQRIVCEWIERSKNGRTSVKHGEGTGRQSASITDADMEWVYDMILQNRQVTVDEMAHQLQISRGSAYESIHNRHGFHEACTWWVPKQLTELHKEKHLDICKRLLDCYGAEGDHFLERIVTGDETWTHHYEPESKRQSMGWKHRPSPTEKNSKRIQPQESLCLQFLKHYQDTG